jgi:hypothetical protein
MLSDNELADTSAQLQDFHLASTKQQETLAEVLEKYGTLIESYKRLKSDYEEERDSRERYKQMARGQERNPFVLVLVDGDGYIFDDDLVSNGAEGGQRAAHLLNDAILSSLRTRGLENCRIMVRVYTNLAGLSKTLSRIKLCGAEKRSLAAFAANFTRSNELFDFVDAGELKENADSKIRALFRQFVDNTQCRHIYFAGCHDVGYINELIPHRNNREKVTLVRNYATHPEFTKLGMRIEDFPGVFRSTPVDSSSAQTYKAPTPANKAPSMSGIPEQPKAKPCYFFQKGLCKYGDGCANLHVKSTNGNGVPGTQDQNPSTNASWRNTAPESKFGSTSDIDFMRSNGHTPHSSTSQADQTEPDFAALLPHTDSVPHGFVALNAKGERLDVYMPPVTADVRHRFSQRVAKQKLCNKFHLTGDCPDLATNNCSFDHSSIDESLRNYLRAIAASTPCTRRSGCKNLTCLNGHVCQKPDCKYRGGKLFCKLPGPMHYVQLQFKENVPGASPPQGKRENVGSCSPTPPPHKEYDLPLRSPTSGTNATKSFFGLNRVASEAESSLHSIDAEGSDDDNERLLARLGEREAFRERMERFRNTGHGVDSDSDLD